MVLVACDAKIGLQDMLNSQRVHSENHLNQQKTQLNKVLETGLSGLRLSGESPLRACGDKWAKSTFE